MRDATFAELLRSPLDPEAGQRDGSPLWGIALMGLICGLVVGVALGWWTQDSEEPVPPASAPVTSNGATTSTMVAPRPVGFSTEFVDAGRSVGVRPIAVLRDDASVRLLVATAVRSDRDQVTTAPFTGMAWTIEGDGGRPALSGGRVVDHPHLPGMATVEFPDAAADATPTVATVQWASDVTVRSGCNGCGQFQTDEASADEVIEAATPFASDEVRRIDVGSGLTLIVEELLVAEEHGLVTWRIEGPDALQVRLDAVITFLGTDDPRTSEFDDPTVLVAEHLAPRRFGSPIVGTAPFLREGVTRLLRVGEPIGGENQIDALQITWTVAWRAPVGDPIVMMLEDLPTVDMRTAG